MKRWNVLALGLVLLLGPVALAQARAGAGSAAVDADSSARALSVYEEGKRLYDAKSYAGALAKFEQAAALEPGKARWQYNRGLALRKLNRYPEARDAFLQSRALEPAYKKAEIDDKLREMGFSPEGSTATSSPSASAGVSPPGDSARSTASGIDVAVAIVVGLFVFGIPIACIAIIVRALLKGPRHRKTQEAPSRAKAPRTFRAPMSAEQLTPWAQRLDRVSDSLISVEHALRLEEDADLRALLNQATMKEQKARDELALARRGESDANSLESRVRTAEVGAREPAERARSLFGDIAFNPEGERVGCYFCARPLANPSFRRQVPLKRGSDVTQVLACAPCANMASAGQPPQVKVGTAGAQTVHWSELDGYDPYTHYHKPFPGTRMAPLWDFTPRRSMAELAAMAAGGALVGGLATYAVSQLLDLDHAREAAAARAAAQAAARRASERREERDWRDHS